MNHLQQVDNVTNLLVEAQDQMMRTIYEIITLTALAAVLERNSLADDLLTLRDILGKQHDAVFAILDQFGFFGGNPPSSKGINRAKAWISALDRALDSNRPDFDGGTALFALLEDTRPLIASAISRSKDDLKDALTQARSDEHSQSLNADQKAAILVKGLIKWGIETIDIQGKPIQKAKELHHRLKVAQSLGADERSAFLDLEVRLTGNNPYARIKEVMHAKIPAVTWDQVTIRLS